MLTTCLISKEEITQLKFYKEANFLDEAQKKQLLDKLSRAERLGNAYHGKVRITFKQQDGNLNTVETTVWATTNEYVTLKGGVNIPLNSITEVEF
jgi:hypothetical protein